MLIEQSSQPTHTEEFWAPDSQPRRVSVSTAQSDFTVKKKKQQNSGFKSQRGKSCYLQGCKAAAAAGWEDGRDAGR